MQKLSSRRIKEIKKDLIALKRSNKSSIDISCEMINFVVKVYEEEIRRNNPNFSDQEVLRVLQGMLMPKEKGST